MSQKQNTRSAAPLSSLLDIVCHPLRIGSLIYLTDRQGSVAEIASALKADKGTISYHVKKLLGAGAVEIVDTLKKPHGPHESVYRAVQRPMMNDEESAALPDPERRAWIERIFGLMVADTTAAMKSGTFAGRPDHHIARFPAVVDEEGWVDLRVLMAETLDRAMDIQAESAARMVEDSEAQSIPVRVMTMLFESPSQPNRGTEQV